MTYPSRAIASIIWFRFDASSGFTRNTLWPPDPVSGFKTIVPFSAFRKALMSARSRVMIVRGRTCSGKSWKYILFAAEESPSGSFITSSPRCRARLPKTMPACCAQGRSIASSEGSLRSIRTSMSDNDRRSCVAPFSWIEAR